MPGLSRRSLLIGALPFLAGSTLARRRSPFGTVRVVEEHGIWVLEEDGQPMSAFDPAAPDRLVYAYLHLLAACAGPPGRALVIGVAGGSFSRWLVRAGFEVEGVEINRTTYRLARRHFGLDGIRVHVEDGRRFLDREEGPWDLVVLDASTEDYIPPALLSVECFERVRAVLAPGGRVLMNSWAGAPRAEDELATWRAVFGEGWIVDDPTVTETDNRVLCSVPVASDTFRVRPMPRGGHVLHDLPG